MSFNNRQNNGYNNRSQQKSAYYQPNQNQLAKTQQLVDYIYSVLDLREFKYKVLENESDLNFLTKHKHYVSANFYGTSCLMVFTKIMDKFYSCIIDRKTLAYDENRLVIEDVKSYPVNVRLDPSIYNGTIFDGIYINNRKTKDKHFIITDVYYFRGKNLIGDDILYKNMEITSYLKMNYDSENSMNNMLIHTNKLYPANEILKVKSDMEKSKAFEFRGFAFHPETSGTKLIFLNAEPKTISTPNSEIVQKKVAKTVYTAKDPSKELIFDLEVRKTDKPDVYQIFCMEEYNDKIQLRKLGIAFIPDIKTSSMCKTILESKTKGKMLMQCKFNNLKGKWCPLKEAKSKKPADFLEISKHLDITQTFEDVKRNTDSD